MSKSRKSELCSLASGVALAMFVMAAYFLYEATVTHVRTIWANQDWLAVLVFVGIGFGLLWVHKTLKDELG